MKDAMKEYQAYLFDLDGTLVNSEPLKAQALSMACKDYGVTVDQNIYKAVMGENWETVTGYFFQHAGISPSLSEFNLHFRTYYEALLSDQVSLNSGALRYIESLRAAGKPCAIVSSAASWMVEQILEDLAINHLFDVVITQEDVSKHKPDPQAYTLALHQLALPATAAVVFEDSSAGVLAGIQSGCDVIAFAHDFNGQNDFSQALQVIQNYDDLMPVQL
ncbi:HAD family phosphatase (plasmid) [Photobacterium sp. GJ3]|uniref:HAD family hydrolase n=1 Tax=Photobacterium sp. GJ3 TaxID=2829502 RepID=UPI001B8B6B1D|nr:HAD family phosphatase [Photobacterium sp. GJ3]QUJ69798.1 HAD family phosphatase [Photobacterium sp. GJ3]